MKVGIDGRLYSQSGLGRYIRNLIDHLQKLDTTNEYTLFLSRGDYPEVKLPSNFRKVEANFRWYSLSEQTGFLKLLQKEPVDLMHFPHFNVPLFYNKPYVVTIHDLIHQHFVTRDVTTRNPIVFSFKKAGYKAVFSHAVKRSLKVITPSQFVKNQLVEEWKIDPGKIAITYEAAEETLVKLSGTVDKEDIDEVNKKYEINSPYLFYVGNAQPHKNLERLIEAFLTLRKEFPNLSLVLSGPNHAFWEKIKRSHTGDNIIFTGFVSDKEMVALYKNSSVFVLPSLEEGFGIPVLEAMACGAPVVCSNAASLPEVGGSAAVYFDPKNIDELARSIKKVLKNDSLRQTLIKEGRDRYKEFSWDRLGEETLKVYSSVLNP